MTNFRSVRFRSHDGAPLAARVGGEAGAFPILFLHGWLADSRVWNEVAADLARDHRVVTLDLRGCGGSARAAGPYALETFAADCDALVRAVSLDPALVVGHSMGAAVAQYVAIETPEAVEALALVNPTPPSGVVFAPRIDEMFRAMPGERELLLAWLRRLTVLPMDPPMERELLEAALAVDPNAAREAYEAWSGADFADDAATIEQPVLVIAGERDRALPPGLLAREIVAPLAHAKMEIVDAAGHYLPIERPGLIAERLRAFVETL